MTRVILYSILLILGLLIAFFFDLDPIRPILSFLTMSCLSYIMIEVGLEFKIDKEHLASYGKDYLVAFTAAAFPWLFCAAYFIWVLGVEWQEALLIGRFAAPTSAGILFTMLAAAGLGASWLFQKARILAIFDDVDTILLLIPLQMMIVGLQWKLFILIPVVLAMIFLAYRFLHRLRWPSSTYPLVGYGILLTLMTEGISHSTDLQIEVLLPAFCFGSILFPPKESTIKSERVHYHAFIEPENRHEKWVDAAMKYGFMFLVGASLPRIKLTPNHMWIVILHVLLITFLSNLGKLYPSLCYKKEASLRERIALGVAMFPRGEVGAGILLLTTTYGLSAEAVGVAELSLALNLLLTGVFIWMVMLLLRAPPAGQAPSK